MNLLRHETLPTLRLSLAGALVFLSLTACNHPRIDSFDPAVGDEGDEVTIRGARLTPDTDVEFNGVPVEDIVSSKPSEVVVKVPTGASTGPIRLANDHGWDTTDEDFTVSTMALMNTEPLNNNPTSPPIIQSGEYVEDVIVGNESDHFWVQSGRRLAADIWAWTLEARLTNQSTNNVKLALRVWDLDGDPLTKSMDVGFNRSASLWITVRTGRRVRLQVSRGEGGNPNLDIPYELHVGRIPVDDPHEPNDAVGDATPLGGENPYNLQSFLVPRFDPGTPPQEGLPDVFSVPGVRNGDTIAVALGLGLAQPPFPVRLEILRDGVAVPEGDGVNVPFGSVTSVVGMSALTLDYPVTDSGNHAWAVRMSPKFSLPFHGEGPIPAYLRTPMSLLINVQTP